MLFGKKNAKKEAEMYMSEIQDFANSLMNDKEVFPNGGKGRGVGHIVAGLCCFLIAGFYNKPNVAAEIPQLFHDAMLENGLSKQDTDILVNALSDAYTDFRDTAIQTQEMSNNDVYTVIVALAMRVAEWFQIENNDIANKAIAEYITTFIKKFIR